MTLNKLLSEMQKTGRSLNIRRDSWDEKDAVYVAGVATKETEGDYLFTVEDGKRTKDIAFLSAEDITADDWNICEMKEPAKAKPNREETVFSYIAELESGKYTGFVVLATEEQATVKAVLTELVQMIAEHDIDLDVTDIDMDEVIKSALNRK